MNSKVNGPYEFKSNIMGKLNGPEGEQWANDRLFWPLTVHFGINDRLIWLKAVQFNKKVVK